MIQLLRVGVLYFAVVFAVGFVLGTIRTLWVVPALGARVAELTEAPIMLLAVALAARTIVRRHFQFVQSWQWLTVGLLALGLLLATEFTVVLRLRGLSLSEYFASRDPVSGAVYLVLLCIFALMPLFMFRQHGADAA